MAQQFSAEWASGVINDGTEKAKSFINDPSKMDELFGQLKDKLGDLPGTVAGAFANVPLMISMVKSYITKEYPEVSVKVIATIVGAFIYMVKKNDLISDSIPVLGYMDDIAVLAFALKFVEPELRAYENWKKGIR